MGHLIRMVKDDPGPKVVVEKEVVADPASDGLMAYRVFMDIELVEFGAKPRSGLRGPGVPY